MRKVYKELTPDQKARGVIFSSELVGGGKVHEVFAHGEDCDKLSNIDYYGTKDNYIHLKFGNAHKMWNFTSDFIKEYNGFHTEYTKYATGEYSRFQNAYSVIKYIIDYKIPVNLYFNFTDEPATPKKALKWWFDNNTIRNDLK